MSKCFKCLQICDDFYLKMKCILSYKKMYFVVVGGKGGEIIYSCADMFLLLC